MTVPRLVPLACCAATLVLCIVGGGCKRTATSSSVVKPSVRSVVTASVLGDYLTPEGTLREELKTDRQHVGDGSGRRFTTTVEPDGKWTIASFYFGKFVSNKDETKTGKLGKDALLRLAESLEGNDFMNLRNIGSTSTNFLDPQDIKIQFGKRVVHYHSPNNESDNVRALVSRYWSIMETVGKLIRESEEKKHD